VRAEFLDHIDAAWLREREDHAATQGFLGGLTLGILLGVVLALVLAPRRGDGTRAVVAETAHQVRVKASHLISRGGPHEGMPDFGDGPAIEREIGAPAAPAHST